MTFGRIFNGLLIVASVSAMSLITAPVHAGQAVPPSALLQQGSGTVEIYHTSAADFGAGTPGLCSVVETGDVVETEVGEVILAPTAGAEFSGTSLPAGWESSEWFNGGGSTVATGLLSVDRARVNTVENYTSGHAIEFVATFGDDELQHVGFGQFLPAESSESWAIFSTFNITSGIYARTNFQGIKSNTLIAGIARGESHRYRIEWNSTGVNYYVEGDLVEASTIAVLDEMRPVASDFYTNTNLLVDWIRMSPYVSSCTFTSAVLAGGGNLNFDWLDLTLTVDKPAGTAIRFETRSGHHAHPNDPSWSNWQAVDANNAIVSPNNPYFQYRAILSTTNTDITPVVEKVIINATSENVNQTPVLGEIDDQTVAEGTLLTFTASATDIDLPANALTYTLVDAPAGASIGATNGQFTWTPTEVQGPGVYIITVRVSDNGTPSRSDEQEVPITVTEVNQAPMLDEIGDWTVAEGNELSFVASVTDNDLPANALTYTLQDAPAGASIGATSGQFSWTPTEVQGPGDYAITVRVNDNGTPNLSDELEVQLTVTEVNQAPVLAAISNQSVAEGNELGFVVSATDSDVPANNSLSYSLVDAPVGASIGAMTGQFSWTPTEVQGPGVYIITVRVADNGAPSLSDEQEVQLTVTEVNQAPVLSEIGDQSNAVKNSVELEVNAQDAENNALTFSATDLPNGLSINPSTGRVGGTISLGAASNSPYRVTVTVSDGQGGTDSESFEWTVNNVQAPLSVAMVGSGTVEVTPPQATYALGEMVTLIATSAAGWSFAGWNGDATGATNPLTITIDGSKIVTATFTQDEYTLTLNVIGNGTVTKEPDQATYHFGDVVTISAIALNGWVFENWQGNVLDADASISITIQGNTTIDTLFVEDPLVPQNKFKLALPMIQGGAKPD